MVCEQKERLLQTALAAINVHSENVLRLSRESVNPELPLEQLVELRHQVERHSPGAKEAWEAYKKRVGGHNC